MILRYFGGLVGKFTILLLVLAHGSEGRTDCSYTRPAKRMETMGTVRMAAGIRFPHGAVGSKGFHEGEETRGSSQGLPSFHLGTADMSHVPCGYELEKGLKILGTLTCVVSIAE